MSSVQSNCSSDYLPHLKQMLRCAQDGNKSGYYEALVKAQAAGCNCLEDLKNPWRGPIISKVTGVGADRKVERRFAAKTTAVDKLQFEIEQAKLGVMPSEQPAETEDQPGEYGDNEERDKWLFENRPKMTLAQLEKELEKKKDCTPIDQRSIRHAIERYARHFRKPVPKGRQGRPKKT